MVNHARKLISMLVLMDPTEETELFMLETAAGFRKGRGPLDALTILLLTIDLMINLGLEMIVVFLDLAGAFDTILYIYVCDAYPPGRVRIIYSTIIRLQTPSSSTSSVVTIYFRLADLTSVVRIARAFNEKANHTSPYSRIQQLP